MNRVHSIATPATPLSAEARVSRRDFLALATKAALALSGLLTGAGLLRYLGYRSAPRPQTAFDLGPEADFGLEPRRLIPEASAVILTTASGRVALSLICPHLGCVIRTQTDGFQCPCHGSRFNPQGGLVRGPADKGLRHLRLETNANGHLVLHTD